MVQLELGVVENELELEDGEKKMIVECFECELVWDGEDNSARKMFRSSFILHVCGLWLFC